MPTPTETIQNTRSHDAATGGAHAAPSTPAPLSPAEWPFEPRYTDVSGHRVHYVDEGEGPLLLFVHAGFWSFVWRDLIALLRRDFRCVALDFPGHGLTREAPGYRLGLVPHRDTLEGFVDRLGIASATLVVHDLGGPIGLSWASRRPELVRGIVAVNTFAWPPEQRALRGMIRLVGSRAMTAIGTATNLVPLASSSRFGVGRQLGREGRRVFLAPFRDRARRRAFHELMRDASRSAVFLAEVERGVRTRLREQPILTVYGEKNDPFGFQARFKGIFPHAVEYRVEDGNHFPMCDDPQGVAAVLKRWWSDAVEG